MKRLSFFLLVAYILCCLTACYTQSSTPTANETPPASSTAPTKQPVSQLSMAAISLPVTTETAYSADNKEIFHYTYQSIQLTLPDPDVADKIIIHFLEEVDNTRSIADDIKASAEKDQKYPNSQTPYLCQILFEPMRIDQNVLSLFGNLVTYSGEPHPQSALISHTYDLTTGQAVSLQDLLSEGATANALSNLIIDSLSSRTDLFPDFEEIVRHRIGLNFKHDTGWYLSTKGLCFYFAPYDIAPYSVGIIHAQIPYDKLIGILNDAYFPAESEPADGSLSAMRVDKNTIEQFTQICEISVGNGNEQCLLYTDRSVYNLRISLPGNADQVIFSTHALTPGDAVIIQGLDKSAPSDVYITFESNDKHITTQLEFDPSNQSYTLHHRA